MNVQPLAAVDPAATAGTASAAHPAQVEAYGKAYERFDGYGDR